LKVDISVVSHGQGCLVEKLLFDLVGYKVHVGKIIVTLNIFEPPVNVPGSLEGQVFFVRNDVPAGFGANHNAAVARMESDLICILNPDLRVGTSPFEYLSETLADPSVALVAPRIISPTGVDEDSVRSFITVQDILRKVWKKVVGKSPEGSCTSHSGDTVSVDWVGGMFMMVKRQAFADIGGFDEKFFLYYEDVDLCARFKKAGWAVKYDPRAEVVHDARRTSHTNLRYLKWHLSSMLRYFIKHGFFRFR